MILSTTSTLQDRKIIKYIGIVTGEAIMGANIFKDFLAGITDIIGGRASSYEKELKKAKEIAINEMVEEAKKMGANAVIGIDIDYETIGERMLMVSVSGTAVLVE